MASTPSPAASTMDVLEAVLVKLDEGDYKTAIDVIADPANDTTIKLQSMELVSLVANHLTDANAEHKPELYSATETILNGIAHKCSPPEVLYELMEKVHTATSDDVFTSLLKSMQVSILRLPAKRARCLEWVFQTIFDYLDKIPLPDVLNKDMEEREEDLLECEESIRRLLQLYITLLLFLEPIVKQLAQPSDKVFFETSLTQKNALIHFLLRLMGKLFPVLQLQRIEKPRKTLRHPSKLPAGKSYSIQVAEDLIRSFVLLVKDPLFLLPYGEQRNNLQSKRKKADSDEKSDNESYTLEGLAVLFYLLLSEGLLPDTAPQIYDRRYIFEMGLRYVVILLSGERTVVYYKGIRLAQALVKLVKDSGLSSRDLGEPIHRTFCERYVRALERTGSVRNRAVGISVLTDYIHTFDDEGRYMIISHMLKTFDDDSVRAYAITVYKDLISSDVRDKPAEAPLVRWYSGDVLQDMLTNHICVLRKGVKTDLIDNSYSITSALSALWVLLKTDQCNRSHIWDYFGTLEAQFLVELRKAIDITRAHYKNEMKATEVDNHPIMEQSAELTVSMLNGELPPVLTKEKKVELCQGMLLRLDMLDFQLARVNGAIEQMRRRNVLSNSRTLGKTETVKSVTTIPRRNLGSTGLLRRANETFDDFRAREEKKEQEYAKQQQAAGATGTAGSSSTHTDTFSSTTEEQTDPTVERTKALILDAALAFVQSHGWSKQAIAKGAEAVNYPSVSHGLFPRGGIELVHHFYKQCNLKLIDYLKQETADVEKVPNPSEFARKAIQFRLSLLEPYLKYWPQALGLMALPPNAPHSLANVLTLVDDICYYAGDRSVDFNWYTRRIGLACIYKTAELYMLQDTSAGFEKTWKFLERRMEEASLVHEFLVKSEDATHHLQNAVGSAFTTARNILGLNFDRR
uniref:Uncharacterized protein n=1 Tax=Anopheles minimus TaxID=112268 RepID=A0A182WMJ5_9DIPT